MDTSKSCFKGVYPFSELKTELGSSYQSDYIKDYLSEKKVKTYVVEEHYVDKDYLIDFAKFYSRSYDIDDKYTTRFHFFSEEFSKDDLIGCLNDHKSKLYPKLVSSYLGFVVRKPVKDINGNSFIGKTLLSTYDKTINGEKRFFIAQKHHVSFFGLPLFVDTLPYHTQDQAVGGCATSACWVTLHSLNALFGIQKLSPVEITEISVAYPTLDRNFPSSGLTLPQMKHQFTSMGLETEFIDLATDNKKFNKYYKKTDDIVTDVIKAYARIGLPIIAALMIIEYEGQPQNSTPLHAVVISGYRHKKGIVSEIYIHDDQIGPYHHTFPVEGSFSLWNNDWLTKKKDEISAIKVRPYKLLIPIYPKMRLNFLKIYFIFLRIKREMERSIEKEDLKGDMRADLFLITLNEYKEFLWRKTFDNKSEILCMPLPRFIWIIRTWYEGKPKKDIIYDGTSVYAQKLLKSPIIFR